jgi:hypothetical protein
MTLMLENQADIAVRAEMDEYLELGSGEARE